MMCVFGSKEGGQLRGAPVNDALVFLQAHLFRTFQRGLEYVRTPLFRTATYKVKREVKRVMRVRDTNRVLREVFYWRRARRCRHQERVKDPILAGTRRFPRSIQGDGYSCGAHSVYMVSCYFKLPHTYKEVKRAVKTTYDGTKVDPMMRFFRSNGLSVDYRAKMCFPDLREALERGAVVLVHLSEGHFGVVHAVSEKNVYLADPSIRLQFGRRLGRGKFKRRWGSWGLVVRA